MKDSVWFWLFNVTMFGGGFLLGYYIAVAREHNRRMAQFDKLKRELAAVDQQRRIRARIEDERISKLL